MGFAQVPCPAPLRSEPRAKLPPNYTGAIWPVLGTTTTITSKTCKIAQKTSLGCRVRDYFHAWWAFKAKVGI